MFLRFKLVWLSYRENFLPWLKFPFRYLSIHLDFNPLFGFLHQLKSLRVQCSFAQPRLSCEASTSPFSSLYTARVHDNSDRHHRPTPVWHLCQNCSLLSFPWPLGPNLDLFGLEIFCLVGISLFLFPFRCCSQQPDRPKGEEKSTEKIRARSSISPQFGTWNADWTSSQSGTLY